MQRCNLRRQYAQLRLQFITSNLRKYYENQDETRMMFFFYSK